MNIPKKVKIGGLEFSVKERKNELRDNKRSGSSCGNTQEIVIDSDISQQFKETTFIHELIHQIDFVYNIGLEHQQVFLLEAGIYALIKDNPEIFKIEQQEDKNVQTIKQ